MSEMNLKEAIEREAWQLLGENSMPKVTKFNSWRVACIVGYLKLHGWEWGGQSWQRME